MEYYFVSDKYYFQVTSTTKGSQVKYLRDGYFYKLNKHGNEGFTEYLVYTVLRHSTLPPELVLPYEYCYVNKRLGCRSRNFLSSGECFYTMKHLFSTLTGRSDLTETLALLQDALERLEYILDIVENLGFSRKDYKNYLKILMQLDLLTENCDRHVHNYGLIFKNGNFRLPPIFDNGLSLRTNHDEHPVSCTLSGSFMEQVTVFGFPVEPAFLINYDTLLQEIDGLEVKYGVMSEISVLKKNLQEYEEIFALSDKKGNFKIDVF